MRKRIVKNSPDATLYATGHPSNGNAIRSVLISIFVLLVFLGLTLLGWQYVERANGESAAVKFSYLSKEMATLVIERMKQYEKMAADGMALFAASKSVERDEWNAFVRARKVFENYPGVISCNFVERVRREEKDAFVASVRSDMSVSAEGYPHFSIYPEGDRSDYFAVKYVEPFKSNEHLLGYDAGSEPTRLEAMMKARDEGIPTISPAIKLLVNDKDGFLIFMPIYRNRAPISTVEERRDALLGFSVVAISAEELFRAIFEHQSTFVSVDFHIYDGKIEGTSYPIENLVFDSIAGPESFERVEPYRLEEKLELNVLNRVWTLALFSTKGKYISKTDAMIPLIILIAGGVFSAVVSLLAYSLFSSRQRAVEMAASMIRELKGSEIRFRSVTESITDAIVSANKGGNITLWNKSAEELFGYKPEEVFGRPLTILMPERYRESHKKGMLRVNSGGERRVIGKRVTLHGLRKNGSEFSLELSLTSSESENETMYVGIMRDITEKVKSEEKILNYTQELARFNRIAVGRELRMIELKQEINKLSIEAGKKPPYDVKLTEAENHGGVGLHE